MLEKLDKTFLNQLLNGLILFQVPHRMMILVTWNILLGYQVLLKYTFCSILLHLHILEQQQNDNTQVLNFQYFKKKKTLRSVGIFVEWFEILFLIICPLLQNRDSENFIEISSYLSNIKCILYISDCLKIGIIHFKNAYLKSPKVLNFFELIRWTSAISA